MAATRGGGGSGVVARPIPANAAAHDAPAHAGQGAPLDAAAVTLVGVAAHDGGAPHAL